MLHHDSTKTGWRFEPELHELVLEPSLFASLRAWVEDAEPRPDEMGHFLQALLSNNLVDAGCCADWHNRRQWRPLALLLANDVPRDAWGSPEKVILWWQRAHPHFAKIPTGDEPP